MWIRACLVSVLLLAALGNAAGHFTCPRTGMSVVDRLVLTVITGKSGFRVSTQ